MNHTPMSPSDLQRIYLLYTSYIQSFHSSHLEQGKVTLCKKKKLTD